MRYPTKLLKKQLTPIMLTKDNTQQIKGAAILCMIVLHLFSDASRLPEAGRLAWMGHPLTHAMQICVPIYLFMAGYGLQCVAARGTVTWTNILRRLRKLYVGFWWVAVPFTATGVAVGFYALDWRGLILALTGISTGDVNGEWWFFSLYAELVLLFWLISRIRLGWRGYLLLMLGVLVGSRALMQVLPLDESVIALRHVKMLLIDTNIFMLGCFCSRFDVFGSVMRRLPWLAHPLSVAALVAVPILGRAYLPLIGITELLLVPMFCLGIVNGCEFGGGKIFAFFGRHSMNLWLLHSFFIFYYLNGLTFVTRNPLVMFFTVVALSLLSSILINKIRQWFTNR